MADDPPSRLMLDGAALVANWRELARMSAPAACGAVVKADGYGLGAAEVVARLAQAGCRDFYVATWVEAEALGPMPEGTALAVLHGVRAADMAVAARSAARPVLNSLDQAARWAETGRPCDVMIDTGMNRLGLTPDEARSGLPGGLRIDTLMSHLACADEPGHPLNARQRSLFATAAAQIRADRYSLANSAGISLGRDYLFDVTRPGLALYGGTASPGAAMRQVVGPEAMVLQVRKVRAGDTIGYGATYIAPRDIDVAILNLGYADGYLRAFAGHGAARIGGRSCPVLGRVSMDLIAIDVTGVAVDEGDWAAIEYGLAAAATATGLSQYELLTGLGRRYQRRWS